MGDGVLAYFGWPAAHEDEPERAVRAGLAVANAVGAIAPPKGRPLQTRVGIATGTVVVGDLIGQGAAQEQTVIGETPNLAARLQERASPGGMAIAAATRRLLGDLFRSARSASSGSRASTSPSPLSPSSARARTRAGSPRCGRPA
jgi:class 3 adenylate cyclase